MTEGEHPKVPDQRCADFVELLTAYLDDTLPQETRRRLDEHLGLCEGCRAALSQWRTVVALAGRLTATDVADIDPYVRDRLMATFLESRRR